MEVPFFTGKYADIRYGNKIREKIDQIINKGSFILGEEVALFERNISRYSGVAHTIGVASGSDALYLLLNAFEFPEGSEVITTPYSFFASTSCIARNNLKPVFVDINPGTFNIDSSRIEEKITSRTACILPVDLFCQPADYTTISLLADRYNLKVLEDSAEAFGMEWNNKTAGTLGTAGVYSFFPTKTLGGFGDGGAIVTDNSNLAEKVKALRVHGAVRKYHHRHMGINSRLDALQAGILNIRLEYIQEEIKERAAIYELYRKNLAGVEEVQFPEIHTNAEPVWYVLSLRCRERNSLQKYLYSCNIATSIYYPVPLHLQECFEYLGYKAGDFPEAEKLSDEALALPLFIGMTEQMV